MAFGDICRQVSLSTLIWVTFDYVLFYSLRTRLGYLLKILNQSKLINMHDSPQNLLHAACQWAFVLKATLIRLYCKHELPGSHFTNTLGVVIQRLVLPSRLCLFPTSLLSCTRTYFTKTDTFLQFLYYSYG